MAGRTFVGVTDQNGNAVPNVPMNLQVQSFKVKGPYVTFATKDPYTPNSAFLVTFTFGGKPTMRRLPGLAQISGTSDYLEVISRK